MPPSRKSGRLRMGKLYAKEIVLLNFPDLPPGAAMERLVDLVTRMEEKLSWQGRGTP